MTAIQGVHPYADKFPMLPESELEELAESIKQNGQRQPIVLTDDGLILDGRNRYKACQMVNVEPEVTVYEGDDLAEYVIDSNTSRRHMSTGARAMSTALVLQADGRRNEGRWRRGSVIQDSELGRAWQVAMNQAGHILDHAGDLVDQVISGDLALDAAYKQAEQRRDAERQKLEQQKRLEAEEADSRAFVEENAPDLAAQVGDVFQSYVEAHDVWKRRNREEAERIRREEREQREREAAERRNDEEQARMIGSLLEQVSFLEYETQRTWCIEATGKYPEVLPSNHKKLHTPSRIRELAEAINTYATELENSYARTT